jgi:hypothetical protein
MTRYEMIAYADQLTEKLFYKLRYVDECNHCLFWQEIRSFRLGIVQHIMGNYNYDLLDIQYDDLERYIEYVKEEIDRSNNG